MKAHKIFSTIAALFVGVTLLSACKNEIPMHYPPKEPLPDLPEVKDVHVFNAPLYWSVYEYCYLRELAGDTNIDISDAEWDEIINWVATELKPSGYDMICTDGFCSMLSTDATGFMTQYGSMPLKDLIAKCKAKGLKLGIYDNPLWIHGDLATKVPGTEYTFGSLLYNGTEDVRHPDVEDQWFSWVVVEHPGAREYIDAFFKHYKDLGVEYIRMDFMSWYEDGNDRNMGVVGRGYGRANYGRAMAYIAESAKKYGIFTSVVMPHLYDDAVVEKQYGNMVRIVSDTGTGGWWHCSAQDRGKSYANWPNCMNMFDGFTYWSHLAGKGKVILDGDFIRLNTFEKDCEKEFVISLQIMAGGPVAASDCPWNISADDVHFYTNSELLALNRDRFVGHPLVDKLGDPKSNIWYGQTSDGSWVIGLFNRNDEATSLGVKFSELGIDGDWNVRDLWTHTDEGASNGVVANLEPHSCKIVRLTK